MAVNRYDQKNYYGGVRCHNCTIKPARKHNRLWWSILVPGAHVLCTGLFCKNCYSGLPQHLADVYTATKRETIKNLVTKAIS